MQTEIIISNIIHTGTGFAVVADNMSESVFIPSRVMHGSNVRPGDRVSATLVPNHNRPEKTPWLAVSLDVAQDKPAPKTLADKIREELESGPATTIELARFLDVNSSEVQRALEDMKLPRTDLWALEMDELMTDIGLVAS